MRAKTVKMDTPHRLSLPPAAATGPEAIATTRIERSAEERGVLVEQGQDALSPFRWQGQHDAVDAGRPVPVEDGRVNLTSEHGDRDGLGVPPHSLRVRAEVLRLRQYRVDASPRARKPAVAELDDPSQGVRPFAAQ